MKLFVRSIALACLLVLPAGAQNSPQTPGSSPPAPAPGQAGTAEPRFKNLQVLKDIKEDELLPSMQFIAVSLGVECDHCHVRQQGRLMAELDDKKPKQTARKMITMMRGINTANFEGRNEVTCATCHQGHVEPSAAPPLPNPAKLKEVAQAGPPGQSGSPGAPSQGTPGAAGTSGAAAAPAMPTPDELFAKYESAIGGSAAIDKLKTRVAEASVKTPRGEMHASAWQAAPNKMASETTFANGQGQAMGYNGDKGWQKNGPRVQDVTEAPELENLKLQANFFRDLRFKGQYTRAFTLRSTATLDDHECYVVRGMLPGGMFSDTLYFDKGSGLLLRRVTSERTPLGPLPQQTDFSDYREVSGVKAPFVIKRSRGEQVFTSTITKLTYNVPVEETKFAKPQ